MLLQPKQSRDQNGEPFASSKYVPQSGEIFGIFEQAKESFKSNLAELQEEEAANVKAVNEFKAAKNEEIAD